MMMVSRHLVIPTSSFYCVFLFHNWAADIEFGYEVLSKARFSSFQIGFAFRLKIQFIFLPVFTISLQFIYLSFYFFYCSSCDRTASIFIFGSTLRYKLFQNFLNLSIVHQSIANIGKIVYHHFRTSEFYLLIPLPLFFYLCVQGNSKYPACFQHCEHRF